MNTALSAYLRGYSEKQAQNVPAAKVKTVVQPQKTRTNKLMKTASTLLRGSGR